jgi:hypothetical protein
MLASARSNAGQIEPEDFPYDLGLFLNYDIFLSFHHVSHEFTRYSFSPLELFFVWSRAPFSLMDLDSLLCLGSKNCKKKLSPQTRNVRMLFSVKVDLNSKLLQMP